MSQSYRKLHCKITCSGEKKENTMTRNDQAVTSDAPTTRKWEGLELKLMMIHLQTFNLKQGSQYNGGLSEGKARRWLIPHIRGTSTSKNLATKKL